MKKKIEELFRLAMKVQEKTGAYVNFCVSSYGYKCSILIMDNGFEMHHGYDGSYDMTEEWEEMSEKAYQKAKEHLIRLLRTKKKEATI